MDKDRKISQFWLAKNVVINILISYLARYALHDMVIKLNTLQYVPCTHIQAICRILSIGETSPAFIETAP